MALGEPRTPVICCAKATIVSLPRMTAAPSPAPTPFRMLRMLRRERLFLAALSLAPAPLPTAALLISAHCLSLTLFSLREFGIRATLRARLYFADAFARPRTCCRCDRSPRSQFGVRAPSASILPTDHHPRSGRLVSILGRAGGLASPASRIAKSPSVARGCLPSATPDARRGTGNSRESPRRLGI